MISKDLPPVHANLYKTREHIGRYWPLISSMLTALFPHVMLRIKLQLTEGGYRANRCGGMSLLFSSLLLLR